MMRGRTPAVAALAAGLAVMASGGALAADEKAWTLPEVAQYKGAPLPVAEAITEGLHCNALGVTLTCYDDLAVARDMGALSGGVVALASCSPGHTVWWDGPFAGATLTTLTYPGWTNLPVAWRNQTSSWASGCRSGKLADGLGGAGAQISLAANQSQGSMPLGWNDRADSVYRG